MHARLGATIAGMIAGLTLASPAHADRLVVGVGGDIATVEENGSDYRVIVTEGNARHPSWSPDGKRIAFMRDFDLSRTPTGPTRARSSTWSA